MSTAKAITMPATLSYRLMLVLNCGSSSLKFALFDTGIAPLPRAPLWSGKVQGIGGANPELSASDIPARQLALSPDTSHHGALELILELVLARFGIARLCGVAHRVVHGGTKYFQPTRIDADVLADLKSYIPLAPLHQPFALEAIEILLAANPGLAQVACFDTAFHHTVPAVEQALALPYAAWQRGLRRYGFHGLSYAYMAAVLAERYPDAARGRVIVAHLGSGASLCAMHGGASLATTMGFSALDGLMMGTRCGAIDPGAVLYLMEVEKLSLEQVGDMLYHHSGLLGVSGISSEPRVIVRHEQDEGETGERARLALQLYVRRIVREVGALVAVLGGLDLLVFTAGVGEHNAFVRERVCRALAFLGVELDDGRNAAGAPLISAPASRVTVAIEATNEEWVAARDALRLV